MVLLSLADVDPAALHFRQSERGLRRLDVVAGGRRGGQCLYCESERLVESVGVAVEVVVEDLAELDLSSQIHYNHY